MPAVIVAAGVASRLRPYSSGLPKTLMELEPRLPLAKFILDRLRRAGLRPIYVVTRGEFAEKLAEELGGSVRILLVDEKEFGNLYTVYTALKFVKPPFLVAMSDHIFEYAMLERLLKHSSSKAFTLCLDREPPALDAWEGLKVRIEGGRIVAVGKALESRFGIDTGLIVVREGALRYIEKVIEERGPRATIGEALDLAAKQGDLDFVDVTGLLWKDVDTPEDLLEARRLYPVIAVRELDKASVEPVTSLLVRPISRSIALKVNAQSRVEAVVKLAFAEVALAALTLVLAALNAAPLLTLAFSYAALLLADARELLVSLHGDGGSLKALSLAASAFYDAALLATVAWLAQSWLQGPAQLLALLGLASATVSEAARRFGAAQSPLAAIADRPLLLLSAAFAPFIGQWPPLLLWLASGIASTASLFTALPRVGVRGAPPAPRVEKQPSPVERCVEIVVVNSLKLAVALALLWLAQHALKGLPLSFGAVALTTDDLFSVCWLVLVIYYGYRILVGVRGLVDVLSAKLSSLLRITESSARGIATSVLYLSISVLALLYVPPVLRSAPSIGAPLSTAAALMLLALVLLLLYGFVKELRRTFKGLIRLLASRVASVVEHGG